MRPIPWCTYWIRLCSQTQTRLNPTLWIWERKHCNVRTDTSIRSQNWWLQYTKWKTCSVFAWQQCSEMEQWNGCKTYRTSQIKNHFIIIIYAIIFAIRIRFHPKLSKTEKRVLSMLEEQVKADEEKVKIGTIMLNIIPTLAKKWNQNPSCFYTNRSPWWRRGHNEVFC